MYVSAVCDIIYCLYIDIIIIIVCTIIIVTGTIIIIMLLRWCQLDPIACHVAIDLETLKMDGKKKQVSCSTFHP